MSDHLPPMAECPHCGKGILNTRVEVPRKASFGEKLVLASIPFLMVISGLVGAILGAIGVISWILYGVAAGLEETHYV